MPREKLTPERRRQITREALIDAAADAFAEKGYRGASLAEIAAAAGFTSGAIYSNFSDKEELLFAVLDRYLDRLAESQTAAVERTRAGSEFRGQEDEPPAAASDRIEWALANPEFVMLYGELLMHALRNADFAERFRAFVEEDTERATREILKGAARNGLRPSVPAADLATILTVVANAVGQHAVLDPERSEHWAHLLAYVYRMAADYLEPIPDGGA